METHSYKPNVFPRQVAVLVAGNGLVDSHRCRLRLGLAVADTLRTQLGRRSHLVPLIECPLRVAGRVDREHDGLGTKALHAVQKRFRLCPVLVEVDLVDQRLVALPRGKDFVEAAAGVCRDLDAVNTTGQEAF